LPDKPPLLWHSNAPFCPSGYGAQTALFAPKLNERYDLTVSCYWGLTDATMMWRDGIKLIGSHGKGYGNDTILRHANRYFGGDLRNGLVVTLMDVWILDPKVWGRLNTACWVPVDHDPCPEPVADFFRQSNAVPIAMSRFGETKLKEAGLDPLYVPHGVDTNVFRPYEQADARELTKIPQDRFVVGVVAANKGNPSRKSFREILEAFKRFHDLHPDTVLFLHTEMSGRENGENLWKMVRAFGLPTSAVEVTDQYRMDFDSVKPDVMAAIYSSFDVLLNPARGEGFGIPIIEAQACGIPVIVTDFSAMPELCGAGWTVECDREWSNIASWMARPRVDDIVDALKQAYTHRGDVKLAQKARSFAEGYDADKVLAEHMLPALEQVQARFGDREPVTVDPVARARRKHGHKVAA
jgi:glycosyltransferase involved in cell wall biosynthesis